MYDLSTIASLDFESTSATDLRKTGVAKYAECPTTLVTCGAFHVPGLVKPEGCWDWKGRVPTPLVDWVSDGKIVSAWNAVFEWYIWNGPLRREFPHLPELRMDQMLDTMAVAAVNGLPLGLDQAAEAMPHLGIRKDKEGRKIMMQMARPRARLKDGTFTWWHQDDPAKLTKLVRYCEQDVKVERAILGDLQPMSINERRVWMMDFKMGHRGVEYDRDLAGKMREIASRESVRLDQDMNHLTSHYVPTTRAVGKLLKYAQAAEPKITSLAKDQLAHWIANTSSGRLRKVLLCRQEAAKSSIAKLDAMDAYVCKDGRMRFLTQYGGAMRTLRWAGRGPQVQNFPRSLVKDQAGLVKFILDGGDEEGFRMFFGVTPLQALSSALRGCISAEKGRKFAAIDFSQIEARVLPWLAGDEKKLDLFRDGKDLYVVAAQGIYGQDAINADMRQVGKVSELALGYGGGVGAFQTMGANYGLKMTDAEADIIKAKWRDANPKIVALWYALNNAAIEAVDNSHLTCPAGALTMFMGGAHLYMRLPSGRKLVYRDAKIGTGKFGNDCVTYMGQDQYTRQWVREDTYGGKLVENATQAVARDVMASAMLRCADKGIDIVGTVHDEMLFEAGEHWMGEYYIARHQFLQVPKWARGLPINADGYIGERFKKG